MTEETMKKFCAEMLAVQVGSPAWCQEVKRKPKADWTSNDAVVYAQMCMFKGSGKL
ncbi:MAG: DUF3012 domain-containing protein [Magnetococcales bacterium]|nr:DUF3012 domain-containing protein [Magnetococcales bacterium]